MHIDALAGKFSPGPILVIGGGESVLRTLPLIDFAPRDVISANEHGFYQDRFPVDFIVTGAQHHISGQPMPCVLQKYGVPVIGRHEWADCLLDWELPCNSGLTAIAVAQHLGADRVVAVGIDLGGGYFHDAGRAPIEARDDYEQQFAALEAHMHVPFGVLR